MGATRHTTCPACDRYVGIVATCPYCDADQPAGIRLLRGAVLLMTITCCCLVTWIAGSQHPTRLSLNEASRGMNGAYVSVSGKVKGTPSIQRQADGRQQLSFWVTDDSRHVLVTCPERVGQQLMDEQRLPGKGDSVDVSGTLSVAMDGVALSLRCRQAEWLRVLPRQEAPDA